MKAHSLLSQVIDLIGQCTSSSSRTQIKLFGNKICSGGFRVLLGFGSSRFRRLLRCHRDGTAAPIDGRSLPKKNFHPDTEKGVNRKLIVDFLSELYHSLSEPLPEVKGQCRVPRAIAFRRAHGKRPKKEKTLDLAPLPGARKSQKAKAQAAEGNAESAELQKTLRMLPPGSFSDYLVMLRGRFPERRISLKLFTRVAE